MSDSPAILSTNRGNLEINFDAIQATYRTSAESMNRAAGQLGDTAIEALSAFKPTEIANTARQLAKEAQSMTRDITRQAKKIGSALFQTFANVALTTDLFFVSAACGVTSSASGLARKQSRWYQANTQSQTWAPFRTWAQYLQTENTKIAGTQSYVSISNNKLQIAAKEYVKATSFARKVALAPVVTATNTVLSAGLVPQFVATACFLVPGIPVGLVMVPLSFVNKQLSKGTFEPLQQWSDADLKASVTLLQIAALPLTDG